MPKKLLLNLQLFGEGGGDGGDGSSAAVSAGENNGGTNSGEDTILASIPEKARKYYHKAMERQKGSTTDVQEKPNDNVSQTTNDKGTTEKLSYADLIKSDEYKEEHKAYMDKAIGDRLKKYKGIEDNLGRHKAILDTVATKYGVNPDDENFLDTLAQKIEADDSYYESYAMEHDISTEEARNIVTMQRKAERYDAEQEAKAKQEKMREHLIVLHQNAKKTKAQFPEFDLETEMRNENFRRLCAVTNGDTSAAYMACHYGEILPATVQRASKQIQMQTAQAVASNQARPIENGISSQAPSVVQPNFKGMNSKQLREFAMQQMEKQARR